MSEEQDTLSTKVCKRVSKKRQHISVTCPECRQTRQVRKDTCKTRKTDYCKACGYLARIPKNLGTKICRTCKEEKPTTPEYFYRQHTGQFGFRAQCKACSAQEESSPKYQAKRRAWCEKNREKLCKDQKARRQKNPESACDVSKRYREKNREKIQKRNRLRYARNHEAELQRHKESRIKRKAQIQTYNKAYSQRNPEKRQANELKRRARKYGAAVNDFTAGQWEALQAVYGYRCVYCKPTCWRCQRKKHALTQDHLTPLSKGGNHTASNIVPACRRCNSKKGAGKVLRAVQPLLL